MKTYHSRFHCLRIFVIISLLLLSPAARAVDNPGIADTVPGPGRMSLLVMQSNAQQSIPLPVFIDSDDAKGVAIAARNLSKDFGKVCGTDAPVILTTEIPAGSGDVIVAGTLSSRLIRPLLESGKIDRSQLEGKNEKYIMATVSNPYPGVDNALVIAGSDRRGAIYGIYELSELIGVSPWYDWADVPVQHKNQLYIKKGTYTAGEPAVTYRGIFLNDEGPCLMNWVKNTYGTSYGDHRFYERVFELILRLRGNFLWPAMWDWAFYADDPENSRLADEMGVIIGTSHHEPMARNHQEWARNRQTNGSWNYATNRKVIDDFFVQGIRRMKGTEDIVTIGMRGDGDEAMSADADVALLKKVIANQRKIIARETGKAPDKTPQVWALYKEVLDYYDAGLRVPDDVILLLCDDNWGNVRRLPVGKEQTHPGGWGMYYHVDYVGAPRNSKLLNCTPIQNMWEQLQLTYDYGVDKLWILNVGDLKPMEYPITLFLDMAWNPESFNINNLSGHTLRFFEQQLGAGQAPEAARIFNLLCKYNGRVTPELLDRNTYNLKTGEWKSVADDFARLEAEALRQYVTLSPEYRDAYKELLLFPIQVMANLYEMYYSQAMNHYLYANGMAEANLWADNVEKCFNRDARLMDEYNHVIAGGKWNGMMTQNHIGYTDWHDWFDGDTLPAIFRVADDSPLQGGHSFRHSDGYVAMEAGHFNKITQPGSEARWTYLPYMGRTQGAIAVMPYTLPADGASATYEFTLPADVDSVKVHVITKSTLAFSRLDGHRYDVSVDGQQPVTVNFNGNMNERPENIHTNYYPVVARRVVEKTVGSHVSDAPLHTVTISPLDPGIVLEKIVVDFGGYENAYLFGNESECTKNQIQSLLN